MIPNFNIARTLLLIICLSTLASCASPQIKVHKNVDLKKYRDLYLLPPKEDPRNIIPKVVNRLEAIGFQVTLLDPERPNGGSQGTGFVISNEGHILTCAHLFSGESTATIFADGVRHKAEVIGKDIEKDLCLIKIMQNGSFTEKPLLLNSSRELSMGQDVYTIGFPMTDILGHTPRLSKGYISAVKGIRKNTDALQVSVEIQPGSSGSPLFDNNGGVIGIIQKTINPAYVYAKSGGALPQNLNFALKSDTILEFIKSFRISPLLSSSNKLLSYDKVKNSVVQIQTGPILAGTNKTPKVLARFNYDSFLDIWHRLSMFYIELYDYESGEMILKAGQYADNAFSTEQKVIDATLKQIEAHF